MSHLVKIKLAHPLSDDDVRELGLPADQKYSTGTEVVLNRSYAERLDAAGFVADRLITAYVEPKPDETPAPALPAGKSGKPAAKGGDGE